MMKFEDNNQSYRHGGGNQIQTTGIESPPTSKEILSHTTIRPLLDLEEHRRPCR